MMKNAQMISFPKTSLAKVVPTIQQIAKERTAAVIFLDHAEMRMQERNVSRKQVLQVIRHGDPIGKAEWNTDKERGWVCKFTRITAGVRLGVVAKLVERKDEHSVLIITVISDS